MGIPAFINREHVEEAIRRLIAGGTPPNSQSTKYDVVAPDGTLLPPKVVLSLATEIASGRPLSRGDFSGGDQTNSRLVGLGFEIRLKPHVTISTKRLEDLSPGDILTNDELVQLLKVGNAGGMRWSNARNLLVLIADHTKSLYDDRWDGDVLHYTGKGRTGNQQLSDQNKRLAEQRQTGISVLLFEVFTQGQYQFVGPAELSGEVHSEIQPDESGAPRTVFVFPLKVLSGKIPTPTADQIEKIRVTRQRALGNKSLDQLKALAKLGGKQQPGTRVASATQYERNEAVVAYAKKAARGFCDLCQQIAPFRAKDGPFLECHHVRPLAEGGPDTIENAVALCPNCHRKMHVLKLMADVHCLLVRIGLRG